MRSLRLDVGEVTRLLRAAHEGEPGALERLIPLVYEDLRRLARRQLGHEYAERTLSPTALVHESYLKLGAGAMVAGDRKSTRLNSSHLGISYAVFCLKKTRIVGQYKIGGNSTAQHSDYTKTLQ